MRSAAVAGCPGAPIAPILVATLPAPQMFQETHRPGGFPQTTDALLAALVAAQHGRVASWQLSALEVTDAHLRRRVRAERLDPEHPGVYAVGHPGRYPDAVAMGCTAAHRAQGRRLVRPRPVARQLARGTKGIGRLPRVVEPSGADLRREFEAAFAAFVRRGRRPTHAANVLLDTPLGQLRADALWRDAGFAVELDSWEFHGGRDSFESDRERDIAADLIGLHVGRVTWRMLHGRPQLVARMLDHRLPRR